MYRNTVRISALAVIVGFSAFTIAGGSTQKPGEETEASLLSTSDAIPGVDVVLKKKVYRSLVGRVGNLSGGNSRTGTVVNEQSAGSKKTNKDGSFSFENVPAGTYTLTFDAPKVSPAMAGKVEYLVIVQEVEAGGADNPATTTLDYSKPKTARIPIAKIQDGLDFTVGPQPPGSVFQANTKNKAGVNDSQTSKPKEPKESTPRAMNLRGKIFLVEIGTTRIVRDQSGEKDQ